MTSEQFRIPASNVVGTRLFVIPIRFNFGLNISAVGFRYFTYGRDEYLRILYPVIVTYFLFSEAAEGVNGIFSDLALFLLSSLRMNVRNNTSLNKLGRALSDCFVPGMNILFV